MATEHLLESGYKQIGIITGPTDWWEAQEREAGWQEVMQQTGVYDLDILKVNGDWTAASGDVGLHTLIARAPDIDAVFACNDQMALGAMQAARRLDLDIPKDLGIVGFDDIPEAAYFFPSLTTVRQNAIAVGAVAVEKMNQLIQSGLDENHQNPGVDWIKPRLIVRKSANKALA
jgi:LacI family transcriptional regulator